jgi:hypothetical protein
MFVTEMDQAPIRRETIIEVYCLAFCYFLSSASYSFRRKNANQSKIMILMPHILAETPHLLLELAGSLALKISLSSLLGLVIGGVPDELCFVRYVLDGCFLHLQRF